MRKLNALRIMCFALFLASTVRAQTAPGVTVFVANQRS
jgi:hypothetical protein